MELKYLSYFPSCTAEKKFSIFRPLLSTLTVEAFAFKVEFLNQELLTKSTRMGVGKLLKSNQRLWSHT